MDCLVVKIEMKVGEAEMKVGMKDLLMGH